MESIIFHTNCQMVSFPVTQYSQYYSINAIFHKIFCCLCQVSSEKNEIKIDWGPRQDSQVHFSELCYSSGLCDNSLDSFHSELYFSWYPIKVHSCSYSQKNSPTANFFVKYLCTVFWNSFSLRNIFLFFCVYCELLNSMMSSVYTYRP